jgi:hypothetical protein
MHISGVANIMILFVIPPHVFKRNYYYPLRYCNAVR